MILICPHCHFYAGPFTNKQAAISSWKLMNRHGDPFIRELWAKDYKQMCEAA